MNRVENGGFFAKEPAARGSAVGRLIWAASRAAEWAVLVPVHAHGREARVGRAVAHGLRGEFVFQFSSKIPTFIQYNF